MRRKTFAVTCQVFFFSNLPIQQPEAVLHVVKDNVNLSVGEGQESFPPYKGQQSFVQKQNILSGRDVYYIDVIPDHEILPFYNKLTYRSI